MEAKNYSAYALVAHYKGAVRVQGLRDDAPGFNRTKEEALAHLNSLTGSINSDNFAEKVKDADFAGTGFMGVFKQGDNSIAGVMIDAIKDLKYGEVSGVVELPFGYALLQRHKVEQRAGSRIWIQYSGAKKAPATVTRSKEEARTLAADLCKRMGGSPDQFDALAKEHSNGPFAVRGGIMPKWFNGYQDAAFENAYAALKAGQVSTEPVETPQGFFIILRK